MDISIIIPTFNNSKLLKKTLDSIGDTSKKNFSYEIVVVNNNSTDDTDNLLKLYPEESPVKSFFQPQQGISIAKNTGIINSTGNLIVFTDDDIRPNVNWLNAYWDAYSNNPDGYIWGGSVVSEFESTPPSAKLLKYAPSSIGGMDLGSRKRLIDKNEYFIGANWACARTALDDVGLFNVELGLNPFKKTVMVGEETDLMERLRGKGYKSLYLPNATVYHFVPTIKTTLKHIAERKEALGYYTGLNNSFNILSNSVPAWVYRSLLENMLKYLFLKFLGLDYIKEYLYYRQAKGIFRAAIDQKKRKTTDNDIGAKKG